MKQHRVLYLATLAGVALALSNCTPKPPAAAASKIIQQVEAAGSGPVENASRESLFNWFQNSHKDLAISINQQCQEIKKTAPAAWGDSHEGRVCQAAYDLARFYPKP